MKRQLMGMIFVFLLVLLIVGCGADDEKTPTPEEPDVPTIEEPTPDEPVNPTPEQPSLEPQKKAAVDEIKGYVNALNQENYTSEYWLKIQNLLLEYTVKIVDSKSEEEINNNLNNFKMIFDTLKDIVIVPDNKEVTEEVWNYITEGLKKASEVKDFSFAYDSQLPSLGSDVDEYMSKLNIDLSGIINNTNKEYYFSYDNKANVKIDAMIVNEETSSAQVSYIDVTSEDLTGKYVITIEELFIYLLDDYFDLTLDSTIQIPGRDEPITISELFKSLIGEKDEEGSDVGQDLFDSLVNEIMNLINENTESSMEIKDSKTEVNMMIEKESVVNKYPQLSEIMTADIKITVVLENNKLVKILLKPVIDETEIPDDPIENENNLISLSMIDRVQILFENEKISSVYAFTKVLNADAAIGFRFEYEKIEMPKINKEEYGSLDIDKLIKENKYKENAEKLIDFYLAYEATIKITGKNIEFEDFLASKMNDEFLLFLVNNNDVKLYKEMDDSIINVKNYYVSTKDYFCKNISGLIPTKVTIIEDQSIIESLELISLDVMKVIQLYSDLQTN